MDIKNKIMMVMNVILIEISKKFLINFNSKITIYFIKVTFYGSHQKYVMLFLIHQFYLINVISVS